MRTPFPGRASGLASYATLWLVMMAVRQDWWNWRDPTIVLGFLPIGLAYQAGYSVLAALVMAALVRWAWPRELEDLEEPGAGDAHERR